MMNFDKINFPKNIQKKFLRKLLSIKHHDVTIIMFWRGADSIAATSYRFIKPVEPEGIMVPFIFILG
jgi:hypothetical protein